MDRVTHRRQLLGERFKSAVKEFPDVSPGDLYQPRIPTLEIDVLSRPHGDVLEDSAVSLEVQGVVEPGRDPLNLLAWRKPQPPDHSLHVPFLGIAPGAVDVARLPLNLHKEEERLRRGD